MKYCPHCGKELAELTALCPNCEKSISENADTNTSINSPGMQKMPIKFWLTLAGTVLVVILTFFDWFRLIDRFDHGGSASTGYNFYIIGNIAYNKFGVFLIAALVVAVVLLIISLVKHRSQFGSTLAYIGFSTSAFVSVAFIVFILFLDRNFGGSSSNLSYTALPFLTFAVTCGSIISIRIKDKPLK